MKLIFHTSTRHGLNVLEAHSGKMSANADEVHPRVTLNNVNRRYVGGCNVPFPTIGKHYLAHEAHHHFVSETVIFCLLMLTTILPLLNGADAVLRLLRLAGS